MSDSILFSSVIKYEFTFETFFDIFFNNDPDKKIHAEKVWNEIKEEIDGNKFPLYDDDDFNFFKDLITTLKDYAEEKIAIKKAL